MEAAWSEWLHSLMANEGDSVNITMPSHTMEKSELQSVEKLKSQFAKEFMQRSRFNLTDFLAVLQEARKSYAESSTDNYDDLSFGKMMFLDGCFIVQLLHWTYMEKLETMKMKSQDIPVVERDFLLLENQLPLIVLKEWGYRSGINFVSRLREFITHNIKSRKSYLSVTILSSYKPISHILEIEWVHLTDVIDVRRRSYT
ncbi:hypothetical protein Vadar_014536 [Vaccinium darrowii]|uniref:Uncharacterized protein n=1 Tax=Vaccinium darrowii TaxID=229202 RepID=A0ACB7YVS4_9ERIC|nr:hypothetical protein Vadar_014536 [Vaccinium darrowii]